jgi:hypothetical protein
MAEARVGIKVADDRQTTTIEIGSVGGPSFPVELSLEQLTEVSFIMQPFFRSPGGGSS